MALPFFPATAAPLRSYAFGHLPVGSTYLLSSFDWCCVLPRSTAIGPRVCGSRPCVLGILKHRKASKRHGWGRKSKSLEIQGKDQHHHHLEAYLSSDGKHNEDVQLNGQLHMQIQGKDQHHHHLEASLSSDGKHNEDVQLNDLQSPKGSPSSLTETSSFARDHSGRKRTSLCIAVIGATGELARNKVFPALFALYYCGFLPEEVCARSIMEDLPEGTTNFFTPIDWPYAVDVGIFGYSRKQLSDEDLRSTIAETLTCRVDHHENCGDKLDAFLGQTYYLNGGYDNREGMKRLNSLMGQSEGYHEANRIFYLSVPQEALVDVALSVADNAQTKRGWNRIIIEKPFGFDALSSHQLTRFLLSKFEERQIYRIDHLLGKDLIENLTVLRFSNLVFEPLWSRTYIRSVQVIFSEEYGIESRGRYLGGCGIIRDIIHSHILQTISLFAMEPPVSLDGEDIRDEKVKVLRSIRKLELDDIVLGQHKASSTEKIDPYMDSLTPTFFAAALYIDNARWDGVPFLIKAGMGLTKHRVEIRIQFHHVPGNIYDARIDHNIALATNELILCDPPDEAILLKVNNKVPGLGLQLDASELNLFYKDKYNVEIPDSYEHLLLDVIDGDSHLFMRSDEVEAAWNILSPAIKEIEKNRVVPEFYEFGGRGPVSAYYLGAKHGVRWADD